MRVLVTTDTHYGFDHNTHKVHQKFIKKIRQECENQNIDAVIHCGDWIATEQGELPRTFKMFREGLGDIPILGVEGNHCLWDYSFRARRKKMKKFPSGMPLIQMLEQHKLWAAEYSIHLLENTPYYHSASETLIMGFNGWYMSLSPPTNDATYMPLFVESAPSTQYLSHKAHKDLDNLLLTVDSYPLSAKKKVCVSHFPFHSKDPKYLNMCANPSYLEFIAEKFDYLFVGHSHQTEDFIHTSDSGHSIRVVNPGTKFDLKYHGYNNPNYVIIDL